MNLYLKTLWFLIGFIVIPCINAEQPTCDVVGFESRVVTLSESWGNHNCVILESRKVQCFGKNDYEQLGVSDNSIEGIGPVINFGHSSPVTKVSVGGFFTCALFEDRKVLCWGSNGSGQLGQGRDIAKWSPSSSDTVLPFVNYGSSSVAEDISVGSDHACVLLRNKEIKCWGGNRHYQLGIDHNNDVGKNPDGMGENLKGPSLTGSVSQISAGYECTCVLSTSNHYQCWGGGPDYAFDKTVKHYLVNQDWKIKKVHAGILSACAIWENGSMICWGQNGLGQLGLGIDKSPVSVDDIYKSNKYFDGIQLGSNTHVSDASVGGDYHTCAVNINKVDKGLYCWGSNEYGQLGGLQASNRPIGNRFSHMRTGIKPILLGEGRTVVQVSAGRLHTCALLDNSEVKCWGSIAVHKNPQGSSTEGPTPAPTQILSAHIPRAVEVGCRQVSCSIDDMCSSNRECVFLSPGLSCNCPSTSDQDSVEQCDDPIRVDIIPHSYSSDSVSVKVNSEQPTNIGINLRRWVSDTATDVVPNFSLVVAQIGGDQPDVMSFVIGPITNGNKYQITVGTLTDLQDINLLNRQTFNHEASCACVSQSRYSSGVSADAIAYQDQGLVKFRFPDTSLCETAYEIARKDDDYSTSRFNTTYLTDIGECATSVIETGKDAAESLRDSDLVVGQTYQYELRPIADSELFENIGEPFTVEHTVLWEASVLGKVVESDLSQPVRGAVVWYQVRTADEEIESCVDNDGVPSSWCKTISGNEGDFKLSLQLDHPSLSNEGIASVHFGFEKSLSSCNETVVECEKDSDPKAAVAYLGHLTLDEPVELVYSGAIGESGNVDEVALILGIGVPGGLGLLVGASVLVIRKLGKRVGSRGVAKVLSETDLPEKV